MTEDAITLIRTFIGGAWSILTSTTYPGTKFSVAEVFIGLFLVCVLINVVSFTFGFGDMDRSWNLPKPQNTTISKNRRNDEK